jgi:effector-binding domain-containing protein
MICAFPVAAECKSAVRNIKFNKCPQARLLRQFIKAAYSGLKNAHMEIDDYMMSKNLSMASNPWEVLCYRSHGRKRYRQVGD